MSAMGQGDTINALLSVSDLKVDFTTNDGPVNAVRGVNCHVKKGECLGIVGESGSGKSQTFLAAMGLLSPNGLSRGKIEFGGRNLLDLPKAELNKIRGDRISMIFQDPLTSLTPHLRIGSQMREVLRTHRQMSAAKSDAHCLEWLEQVRIPQAKQRLMQYPHELSGGMRQRVLIAMAMLCDPDVLIADEPTTALDVTIQAEILDLMDELRSEKGTAIVLITHDMGVVARMCDRIEVMRYGEFIESGDAETVFYRPTHAYTKMLLDTVPRINLDKPGRHHHAAPHQSEIKADEFLEVRDLEVEFAMPSRWFSPPLSLKAVDGVSFELAPGQTLGIVGESGSGKSTLARAVLHLIPPTAGTVSWLGSPLNSQDAAELNAKRRDLQIIFQDPVASLNPSMTIGESIAEPVRVFEPELNKQQRREKILDIMRRVGLGETLINRYPHELSGGQNQRVGIARAVILRPKLIICDEAVSALDVSIQAQILDLLMGLQKEFGLSFIFISHDLSVVWEISHRIMVLYLGQIVEMADRDELFRAAEHPYTKQLISAVPIADPKIEKKRERIKLRESAASVLDPLARLRFLPSRMNAANGQTYVPKLLERSPGHFVAEHDPLEDLLI